MESLYGPPAGWGKQESRSSDPAAKPRSRHDGTTVATDSGDLRGKVAALETALVSCRETVRLLEERNGKEISRLNATITDLHAEIGKKNKEIKSLNTELQRQIERGILEKSKVNDQKFQAARWLIAKELHPDNCKGGEAEKLARAEIFKEIWPELEKINAG